ncbi:MAG: PilZ domain-containing protein [Candidatus Omnitrophica bacterium]|nr:PilZ domain-containing protein [Candidatus Omnitrophota bacterium]
MSPKTTAEKNDERRLHPRLDHNLPVKIVANGYDFSTVTKNVSCVGAYCHIPKYVPPFTRVAIKLNLPIVAKAEKKDYAVECKGVIVRTEDEQKGGFNIAVFFNDIKETQKKTISKYISQFIP